MNIYNKIHLLSVTFFATYCAIFRENFLGMLKTVVKICDYIGMQLLCNPLKKTRNYAQKQHHKMARGYCEVFVPIGPYKIGTRQGTYVCTISLKAAVLPGLKSGRALVKKKKKEHILPKTSPPLSLSLSLSLYLYI
jgi:hypothetical protein